MMIQMASLPELSSELDAKRTSAEHTLTDKSSKCEQLVTLLVHHVATGGAQAAADEDFRTQITDGSVTTDLGVPVWM